MRAKPYILLVCLAVVWGVHWPLAKVALRDLPPFTYGALRAGVALVAVAMFLAVRRGIRLPDRRDLPVVLSVGLGQMAGGIVLMNLALPLISAGRSSILVYTMPLWVAVMQMTAFRDSGGMRRAGGLALGLIGIGLLLNPQSIDWSSSGQVLGCAALLFSAIIWAATTIHVRGHEWHSQPIDLEIWQLVIAAIPLVAAALVLEGGRSIDWAPTPIALVIYSGVLATAVAFWLSQSISRSLSPLGATMGFLAVPVVGVISSSLLLAEPLTLLDLVGALVTFAGIAIVSIRPEQQSTANVAPSAPSAPSAASAPGVARAEPPAGG